MAIFKNTPPVVTDGLILYLDAANRQSYVSGSTTWKDISGNNNSGSLVNGPTFDTGNGGSIVFDGVDDFVNMDGYLYSNLNEHTAIAIFQTYDGTAGWQEILQKGQRRDFKIRMSGFGSYRLNLGYETTSGSYDYNYNGIQDSAWYFAGMNIKINNNNASGSINYYINDQKVSQSPVDPNGQLFETDLYPGQFRIGGMSNGSEWLIGEVALALVYERQLSDQEMLQNYNSLKIRFNLT